MSIQYDYVSVNLEVKHKSELSFPFLDFGFLYGYGLFETILIDKGRPILVDEHVQRMRNASMIFGIPFPYTLKQILAAVQAVIDKNKAYMAVMNFYLTPGNRPEVFKQVEFSQPFFLMVLRFYDEDVIKKPVRLGLRQESFQRALLDGYKTLSYMKNIMEKRLSDSYDEVLLYDHERFVLETPASNVFFVKKGKIVTPDSKTIMRSIVGDFLMEYQQDFGVKISKTPVLFEELEEMDEIFLTNSVKGVISVSELEHFPHLKSGEVTQKLSRQYREMLGL